MTSLLNEDTVQDNKVNNEEGLIYRLDDFDLVLMTSCDLHGTARGRFVFRNGVGSMVKHGIGMTPAAMFCGIRCEIPTHMTDLKEAGWPNGAMMPEIGTLKPLSWLSYGGQKVGHMLCNMHDAVGSRPRDESTSRELALRQLNSLKTLGYDIVTSADLEVTLFHKDTLIPVGLHEDVSQLRSTLMTSLLDSSIPVVSIGRGMEEGKLRISLGPQTGVVTADNLHRLRNAIRSVCASRGYDVTYMTKPLSDVSGNGLHYCCTLLASHQSNAFTDENDKHRLSVLGRHWVAGCLRHHATVTALARPTLNCYAVEDLDNLKRSWGYGSQGRTNRMQVCISDMGLSIVDNLPSSASNPYIVLAAIIAAGVQSIVKQMELQDQLPTCDPQTPPSLSQALISLENDKVLQAAIGPKFAERFLLVKKGFEISRDENNQDRDNAIGRLQFERSLYMTML